MSPRLAPDFFIVGAPKCGTTALNSYLGQHPEIFMAPKEQHFFGSDIVMNVELPSAEEYFGSFADGGAAALRGEASVWYLWSQQAARELHDYKPTAKIIVMLRNPIDVLPSLHSEHLTAGAEEIANFEQALAAEDDRRAGRRLPPRSTFPGGLLYREAVDYLPQLKRYVDRFGLSQIHVIIFDDFQAHTGEVYRRTLDFLGVDNQFTPAFPVVNGNKRVRNRWLGDQLRVVRNPRSRVRGAVRTVVPVPRLRHAAMQRVVTPLERWNVTDAPRVDIAPHLRAQLTEELAPGVQALGEFLGRDLAHWCREPLQEPADDTNVTR